MSAIIAVGASKGGTGKTTLSYELASALGGILVDLDWDGGSASRMWGLDPASSRSTPLLDALERGPGGRPPTVRRRPNQPALVPSHPDLSSSNLDDGLVADCLESWAASWDAPFVVVDTHPGANVLTDGALASSDLLVIPVVLGQRELDALETRPPPLSPQPARRRRRPGDRHCGRPPIPGPAPGALGRARRHRRLGRLHREARLRRPDRARDLEAIAKLYPDIDEPTVSTSRGRDGRWSESTSTRLRPAMSPAQLRELERWHALLLYPGLRPVLTEQRPWWREPRYEELIVEARRMMEERVGGGASAVP